MFMNNLCDLISLDAIEWKVHKLFYTLMYPGNNLFHMIESMDDELYLIPNKYLEDRGKGFCLRK